ncbi:MAG TPA: glycosyltransferase family 4 protein [Chitinophagaceae bacterium]|nr:glycosyltransferase family 4 protein [Chitinophagaceae bacterium]
MRNVLILCLHRPNRSPSQRYRFEEYLPYLEQHGYVFEFSYLLNEQDDRIFYQPGHYFQKFCIVAKSTWKRLLNVFRARRYDLAFVQREAYMLGTSFFERAIAARIPLIYDFDDAIWMPVVSEGNKKLAFLKNAAKTAELVRCAALVFAGNAYLAAYAKQYNPNVVIIPTTLDTVKHKLVNKSPTERVCIGWSGSFSTVPHFELAIPALEILQKQYGEKVYFKVIGDSRYVNNQLGIQGIAWSAERELEELAEIDIGIMPLPDDEWSKGKCGFKGLLYMSLGIPAVLSPVGVNTTIITHGENGFLAGSTGEWVDVLSMLVENASLRKSIGLQGRKTVEEKYSVEAWQAKYLALFEGLTN